MPKAGRKLPKQRLRVTLDDAIFISANRVYVDLFSVHGDLLLEFSAAEEERFYVSTVDALADPELRRQVIAQAWRELEVWRERYAELVEFGKLFSEIDQARSA